MSGEQPPVLARATAMIRAGERAQAVDLLMAELPELAPQWHRPVYRLAGLAWYFDGRYAEALGMFQPAAAGSEVPEDWFNVAMARVKVGDIEGGHAAWEECSRLAYAHQDAPETSTLFQKKLLFAEALLAAGAADARGLDLLERELMGFFTHHHVTDASFWGMRGVPAMEDVLALTRRYYTALGRTADEWRGFCDSVMPDVDSDGQAYLATLRDEYPAPEG